MIPLSLLPLKADPQQPDCELPHGHAGGGLLRLGRAVGHGGAAAAPAGLWPGLQPWRLARLGGGRRRGRAC